MQRKGYIKKPVLIQRWIGSNYAHLGTLPEPSPWTGATARVSPSGLYFIGRGGRNARAQVVFQLPFSGTKVLSFHGVKGDIQDVV